MVVDAYCCVLVMDNNASSLMTCWWQKLDLKGVPPDGNGNFSHERKSQKETIHGICCFLQKAQLPFLGVDFNASLAWKIFKDHMMRTMCLPSDS